MKPAKNKKTGGRRIPTPASGAKRGILPLYLQIEQSLMEKIRKGALAEGAPLQSEQELARYYNVSRMTARQALHGLKQNGYVVTVRRKGTFVTTPKIEKVLASLQGFSQEMRAGGMQPRSIVLEHAVVSPPATVLERLRLGYGERVFKLRRVRLADNAPIAVEISYIPIEQFPRIDATDFAQESLYAVLQNRYRCSIGWSEDVIEASKATAEESRLLEIPRGSSILAITRIVKSPEGRPLEVCFSHYRSDRYRATVRIPR